MKRFLTLIALMAAGQSPVGADGRFYVETGVGVTTMYGNMVGKTSGPSANPAVGAESTRFEYFMDSIKSGWGGPQAAASLNVGYACKWSGSPLTVGIFGGGGYGGAGYKAPYNGVAIQTVGTESSTQNINSYALIREKGRFDAGFFLGVLLNSLILPYLRLGYSIHRIDTTLHRQDPVSMAWQKSRIAKWNSAMFVGVGCDYNVTPALAVGVLADFTFGKRTTSDFSKKNLYYTAVQNKDSTDRVIPGSYRGIADKSLATRLKATFTTVMVTAKWSFPACR